MPWHLQFLLIIGVTICDLSKPSETEWDMCDHEISNEVTNFVLTRAQLSR